MFDIAERYHRITRLTVLWCSRVGRYKHLFLHHGINGNRNFRLIKLITMFKTDSSSSGNAFITKSETRDTIILSLAAQSFIIHSIYVRIENTHIHFGYLRCAFLLCTHDYIIVEDYSQNRTLIRVCN